MFRHLKLGMSVGRASTLLVMCACCLCYAVSAEAQWAVFDAANFGKNAMTAMHSAAQYAEQVQSYKLQLMQWQTQMQNLKEVPQEFWNTELGHSVLGQSGGCTALNCVIQASNSIDDVYSETEMTDTEAENLFGEAGAFGEKLNQFSQASGLTPAQVLHQSAERAQAGQGAATSMYEQAKSLDSQLGQWQQQANSNLKAAQNAPGATAAIQAEALQAHLQTTQLSSLLKSSTAIQEASAVRLKQHEQKKAQQDAIDTAANSNLKSYFQSAGVNWSP